MSGLVRAIHALFFTSDASEPYRDDEQPAAPASKPTVLVIDDDAEFLSCVRPLLREAGFNVLTSGSGPKGLDMLRYAPRDLRVVLLDFNMPGFNGAQTLQYVRKLNPAVKVFGVTGINEEELPEEFRQGVDRLVPKPFKTADLIALLKVALA
jgi:CheY-like chemotaxis protein